MSDIQFRYLGRYSVQSRTASCCQPRVWADNKDGSRCHAAEHREAVLRIRKPRARHAEAVPAVRVAKRHQILNGKVFWYRFGICGVETLKLACLALTFY